MTIRLPISSGGFGSPAPRSNAAVDAALDEYEGDIQKAETLAYPPSANFSGAPSLSPLTTQSIQGTMEDETFRNRHLWLWNRLTKRVVKNTLKHEATVVKQVGSNVDPFFNEGGRNAFSEAEFERIEALVKFISENISVPDTAAVIRGGLDGDATILETRTRLGIKSLLGKMERWLIEGDSAVSALQIDGFRKGILARGVVKDLKGGAPSSEILEDTVAELQADGRFALDLEAFTDPRVKRVLTTLDVAAGRYPKDRGGVVSRIGGPSDVVLTTEYGESPVYAMPLIGFEDKLPTGPIGDGPVGITVGAPAVGANALSRFYSGDVGDYDYRFVAVGDKGQSAVISANNVTIGAGDAPTFTFNDDARSAVANAVGMLRYYRVYRTERDGSTFGYIGQFPRAAFGVDTTWTDLNERRPFKRPIFIGEFNESTVLWIQTSEMIRRPLAQVESSIPFMLQLWGNLFFKQGQKWAILDNCAVKAT